MNRSGFTLVEVIVAVVILLGVVLGITQLTARTIHTLTTSDRQLAAVQLVEDRLEQVRLDPDYAQLESSYGGTEYTFRSLPGFARTTQIVHVGGDGKGPDYKRITVSVTGPGLPAPVARTETVGAP